MSSLVLALMNGLFSILMRSSQSDIFKSIETKVMYMKMNSVALSTNLTASS